MSSKLEVGSPRISVCIPAYNRPIALGQLLESVVDQNYDDFEIVVSEDSSPAAEEIREVVQGIACNNPHRKVFFSSNEKNLGYDGNFRRLLELSKGEYCLFIGDDDLLRPGALKRVAEVVNRYKNIGAINRAFLHTDRFTGEVLSKHQYYSGDRFFSAGIDTAASFFRRFVVISGLVLHREQSIKLATNEFDGSLLYQLYLVANLLLNMDGYYISDFIAERRAGEAHFFGSSEIEKNKFVPQKLTPDHSVTFMEGMLSIAKFVDSSRGIEFSNLVIADLASYAYSYLSLHASRKTVLWKYARALGNLGMRRKPIFWLYVGLLLLFPVSVIDKLINVAKTVVGRTPAIGGFYRGQPISRC